MIVEIANQITSEQQPESIALWLFPSFDIEAWQELTGDNMTYAEYHNHINSISADQERQGRTVRVVRMTVAAMIRLLGDRPNNSENRAEVIAQSA